MTEETKMKKELPGVPEPLPYDPQTLTKEEVCSVFAEMKRQGEYIAEPMPIVMATFITERYFPVTFKHQAYLYNPDEGLYYKDTDTVKQIVRDMLHTGMEACTEGLLVSKSVKDANNDPLKLTFPMTHRWDPVLRDVDATVKASGVVEGELFPFNNYAGFPCGNCVVKFTDEGEIKTKPFRHDMRFTRKIPVNYNPEAKPELAKAVLKAWMPDKEHEADRWKWLVQIPAQMIIQSFPDISPFKQAYLVLGKPNAGKSSYFDLLAMLFGAGNHSTLMLHELGNDFLIAELPGKYFNAGDDLPFVKVDAANKFKTLTGKRIFDVNPKFERPYKTQITAVQLFAANYPPEIAPALDSDEGWWVRWNIIQFEEEFPKVPDWEKKTFTQEFLESFLLLVLEEVSAIIKNGNRLLRSQSSEEVHKMWSCNLKLFHNFVDFCLDKTDDKNDTISTDEMLRVLNQWSVYVMPTLASTQGIPQTELMKQLPNTRKGIGPALAMEDIHRGQAFDEDGKHTTPFIGVRWKPQMSGHSWFKPEK